ncbi:alpha/beta hydrolase [Flavobacteriaceae bacterium F08102]|nr:alpha/beta hydrolase [Flavobacteriaceae bacterium F08102]
MTCRYSYSKRTVVFLFTLILCLTACSDSENLGNLDDTFFLRRANADMPVYVHGNGSEKVFLLLLHGGPGGAGLNYRAGTIKNEIEKKYAVVYYDQRGSGMSQGSYNKNGISVDIMVDDVLALVKVIKHKYGDDSRFFLMGHSWGGTLGTATLLKDQHLFKGWIEVDGAHNPSGLYYEYINLLTKTAHEQIAEGHHIEFWEKVLKDVQNVDQHKINLDDFYILNSTAHQGEVRLANDHVIYQANFDDGNAFLFKYNLITYFSNRFQTGDILSNKGMWKTLDFTSRLHEITIPSLLLWGKHDLVVPLKFGQEAFQKLGSTSKRLVVFENSAHSPMAMEGDDFAREVLQFMDAYK